MEDAILITAAQPAINTAIAAYTCRRDKVVAVDAVCEYLRFAAAMLS